METSSKRGVAVWWRNLTVRASERGQALARSRHGLWLLAFVSFIEAALPVPIITDPFLVGYILANRTNTFKATIVTTISSVMGGVFAYYTVALMFTSIIDWFGHETVASIRVAGDAPLSVVMATLIGAVTPVPYTFTAWAVALVGGGVVWFIGASMVGRGMRYIVVASAAYYVGPGALAVARRHIGIASMVVVVLAILFMFYKIIL